MRGNRELQNPLLFVANTEERLAKSHPLRAIKRRADEVLAQMGRAFDAASARNDGVAQQEIVPPAFYNRACRLDAMFWVRIVAISSFLLVMSWPAQACSCLPVGPPCQAAWEADAVFVGRVIDFGFTSDSNDLRSLVRFRVSERFRGDEDQFINVVTGLGGPDCGLDFDWGRRYLVYAYRARDGRLTTSICTRTRRLDEAADDLAYLRNLSLTGLQVRVAGTLMRSFWNFTRGDSPPNEPLSGVPIVVTQAERKWETTTDANGRFEISDLPPGNLQLRPHLPPGLAYAKTRSPHFAIVDEPADGGEPLRLELVPRSCVDMSMVVYADGRIAGRVLEADGRPAADVRIEVKPADHPHDRVNFRPRTAISDSTGRFELTGIPPGRYVVGVNLFKRPSLTFGAPPYPPTYLPGVAERSKAAVIELGEAARRSGLTLRLPSRLDESEIQVTVVTRNGRPVPAAYVTLWDPGDPEDQQTFGTKTDKQGRASIRAYSGYGYFIEAYTPYRRGWFVFGARQMCGYQTILQASGSESVRVVLSETACSPFDRLRRAGSLQTKR